MKRLFIVLLIILLALSCATCAQESRLEPIEAAEVGNITASTAIYSNYLYIITDEQGIAELVELYNGLRYEPTDEVSFSDLLGDTLYTITYHGKSASSKPLANVWISPQGYVYFSDSDGEMPVYRLTSSFDEEKLKSLLKEYDSSEAPVLDVDKVEPIFDSDYANDVISSVENK